MSRHACLPRIHSLVPCLQESCSQLFGLVSVTQTSICNCTHAVVANNLATPPLPAAMPMPPAEMLSGATGSADGWTWEEAGPTSGTGKGTGSGSTMNPPSATGAGKGYAEHSPPPGVTGGGKGRDPQPYAMMFTHSTPTPMGPPAKKAPPNFKAPPPTAAQRPGGEAPRPQLRGPKPPEGRQARGFRNTNPAVPRVPGGTFVEGTPPVSMLDAAYDDALEVELWSFGHTNLMAHYYWRGTSCEESAGPVHAALEDPAELAWPG